MTLSAFMAAWFIHLVAAASPGPTILMSARIGVTEGMRPGFYYALGCGIGALFWALAALFGLAVLFRVAPEILWGFRLAGGLFLLWLAVGMWRHAADPLPEAAVGSPPRKAGSALRLGVATQIANPKPAIFFGAVFVGTVPPGTTALALGLLLAAIFVNEVSCTAIVARVFSLEASRRTYGRLKSRVDRVFGGLLALFGLRVVLA